MWRGSVERIPQAPGLRACVEGRSARRYVIFIFLRSRQRARAENHNLMFRSTERTHGERGAFAASALPSIRTPTLHARRALSRALRVFRRAHHVDMSCVHRRAGFAEHRRRTADQVQTEQTRESSGGGAVVRPAPEPPASAPQPHPAHVCGAARACTRRNRRCWWLALLLGGGLARARDYECSLRLETMVSSVRRWGLPLARPARGQRAAPATSLCHPQPLKRGGGGEGPVELWS